MPKREDDFWASQKEGLRYCYKHKRYYREDLGCQLCWMEEHNVTPSPSVKLHRCPFCQQMSLYQQGPNIFDCINIKCLQFGKTQRTLSQARAEKAENIELETSTPSASENRDHVSDEESIKLSLEHAEKIYLQEKEVEPAKNPTSLTHSQPIITNKSGDKMHIKKEANKRFPKWQIALILIFTFSIIGLAIGIYVGTTIPLWILFGFSLTFSLEKWFIHVTQKYRAIGKLYRLLLNLGILSLFSVLISSGIKLFSHQFTASALAGSFVFLSELIFFIWMWKIVSKNSWRWPSMKLTVFCLVCLFIIFAFAGVQPVSKYKDNFIEKMGAIFSSLANISKNPSTNELPSRIPVSPKTIPPFSPSTTVPATPIPTKPSEAIVPKSETSKAVSITDSERMVFDMINMERKNAGMSVTIWNDQLYKLSLAHTQEMEKRGEIFHTSMNAPYGENAWGGKGYYRYTNQELARIIVNSWMSSPLHRAWILHVPLRTSVVSIVVTSSGQYSSWTFLTNEAGAGPPLVQRAYNLWQAETGGRTEWITWLYDIKGYPNNPAFLKQLGIQ